MAEEPPTGDRAVFAFLEMVALAFMFEGVSAFLNGKPFWEFLACFVTALFFFVAGATWSRLKSKIPHVALKTNAASPGLWLAVGAIAGVGLWVTGASLVEHFTEEGRIQSPDEVGKNVRSWLEGLPVRSVPVDAYYFDFHAAYPYLNGEEVEIYMLKHKPNVPSDLLMRTLLSPSVQQHAFLSGLPLQQQAELNSKLTIELTRAELAQSGMFYTPAGPPFAYLIMNRLSITPLFNKEQFGKSLGMMDSMTVLFHQIIQQYVQEHGYAQ
jgi:hypothetical protein